MFFSKVSSNKALLCWNLKGRVDGRVAVWAMLLLVRRGRPSMRVTYSCCLLRTDLLAINICEESCKKYILEGVVCKWSTAGPL
jgi:hypothetical protein